MKFNYQIVSSLLLSIGLATSATADIIIEGIGSISKIQKANVLAVINSYSGLTNMGSVPGAAKDAALLRNLPNSVVVEDADTSKLNVAFGFFASSDCQDRKDARIIWFSGYTHTTSISDSSIFSYSFLGNESFDLQTKKGAYDINRLLVELSSSNCKFIVGIDADPPSYQISIPRNVTIIWASVLGGQAKDTKDGGDLTVSFNKAYATSKIWTANTLTAFLRGNTPKLTDSKPWVQNLFPDDTIYFPSENTPFPEARVSQNYPFDNKVYAR